MTCHLESRMEEHVQHGVVLIKGVGQESTDAAVARRVYQLI